MAVAKVAGIFNTLNEAERFTQKLPGEIYISSTFQANADLTKALRNKRLAVKPSSNEGVVIMEVNTNQLLQVQVLVKNQNGRYVTPEEVYEWQTVGQMVNL